MIIPVRCFTCGKPLGGMWEQYQKRTGKGEKARKVLDDLDLTRYCCRTIMLTHKDMLGEIAKFRS